VVQDQEEISKMADSNVTCTKSAAVLVDISGEPSEILCISCAELELELERTKIELRAAQSSNKAATTGCNGCYSESNLQTDSVKLEINCHFCSNLNKKLQKAKEEILTYKKIIEMLQAELRENSLRNNPSEWVQNNNYMIRNLKPMVSITTLKSVYYSYFHSIMTYRLI
jgi:hypothetical protein